MSERGNGRTSPTCATIRGIHPQLAKLKKINVLKDLRREKSIEQAVASCEGINVSKNEVKIIDNNKKTLAGFGQATTQITVKNLRKSRR